MNPVETLHEQIRACRRCQDAGFIARAAPVVSGRLGNRLMLIGQAPGITELEVRRPFSGRAGKELFRWLRSIGVEENEFRRRVSIAAITRCFPGKARGGSGDRTPSSREIALCRPWLETELALINPVGIILVGGLAIRRFFPEQKLTELIGARIEQGGVAYVPLPHPSGASRWLNSEANKQLLQLALQQVRLVWESASAN